MPSLREAELLEEIAALRIELAITKEVHLQVAKRLQAEVDDLKRQVTKLKEEAEADARYTSWLRSESDRVEAMHANAYDCGEL